MSTNLLTGKGLQMSQDGSGEITIDQVPLPWEEHYRGTTLDDIILPPSIRTMVETALRLNSFGNYILYSGASGTGKTSLAKAIPVMLGTESLFLYGKASEVIAKIEEYKLWKSPNGKPRFVIIDEVDKALNPEKFYKELQSVIESSMATLRFILTCNDIWQVRDAVKSRCIPIEFSMAGCLPDEMKAYKRAVFSRLEYIVQHEVAAVGGRYARQTILDTFNACYPDIRSMIVSLHVTFLKNGGNVVGRPSVFVSEKTISDIWQLVITQNPRGLRMYLSQNVEDPKSVYVPFSKFAVDHIPDKGLFSFGKITADAMADTRGQVDPEIMLYGYLSSVAMLVGQVGHIQAPPRPPAMTPNDLPPAPAPTAPPAPQPGAAK